ncbi:ANR family transcriptional regulator [Mannheimia massilioguelmaensis]|uniref:ANR family transcriptional regulator n=1 Tax=Mannheimia massilioguelmaensis TaxID=1604354 RepID=UPI0005C9325F|nr:ANR family transcriptional regulator [Mannheimia massilioguelmaensis]
MKKQPTQFNIFKHFSEQAAKLERQGKYIDANLAWRDASRNAIKEGDRLWCDNRAQFCLRMVKKPF